MEEESAYLSLQEGEIRLMVLLPGKAKDPISVRLVTTKRAEATYEALSYQWGPPSPAECISVDNRPTQIRQNLFLALVTLRHERIPRCLWVDALCINQQHHAERGSQVSIMSKIFRQATKVLVWLGEAADDSDLLFELMATVEGRLDRLDSLITVWGQAGVDVSNFTKRRIQSAFLAISRRAYWRRLWIIQEVLSASSIDVLCGSKTLSWAFFSCGLEAIGNLKTSSDLDCCAFTPAYAIAAKQSYHNEAYSIEDLIQLCDRCDSQCEDVRDKVFGLVSITKDFGIIPDYAKTAIELCLDIFRCLAKASLLDYWIKEPSETLFSTFQRLLLYPFWNPVDVCYVPLDEDLIANWNRQALSTGLQNVAVRHFDSISRVGPILSTSDIMNDYSVLHTRGLFSKTVFEHVKDLSELEASDLHTTAAIEDHYTKNGSTFIRTHGSLEIGKSDGKVKPFRTLHDDYGIASSIVRKSDLLCYTHGIDDVFIIRLISDNNFVLIGRAIVFASSPLRGGGHFRLGHHLLKAYAHETLPPIQCRFDLRTLLLLKR
ncbi:heterokaryon incompatibility protein-domain-containing protein [Cadophora sp. MPI-SDFR-AT-0126]|nr:heterokaryon incompatibility protein-domain-containing protein [Leotiomycetes sp. MPI-SDFR-AT-0126]